MKLLLLFSYKEKATKRFRELMLDVNTIMDPIKDSVSKTLADKVGKSLRKGR